MLRMIIVLALSSVTILSAGCGASDDSDCSTEAVTGIGVTVRDATTHAPICVEGAVTLSDGEVLRLSPATDLAGAASCSYFGAVEAAGTFVVTAKAAGHADATTTVTVERGRCHVKPVGVVLDLQPK